MAADGIETTRAGVVAAARAWIGTPYVHQASVRGAGTDCLGLVRGVWRDLFGAEPEAPPAYTPDWAEASGEETMAAAARRHLIEIACAQAGAGDVVLFRMRAGRGGARFMNGGSAAGPAKHAAILSAPDRMIHAYSGRAVVETGLGPWWRARVAFAFRFPGVND